MDHGKQRNGLKASPPIGELPSQASRLTRPRLFAGGRRRDRRPVRSAVSPGSPLRARLDHGPHAGLGGLYAEVGDRPGQARPLPPDTDLGPWERAGLTWAVTDFGVEPTEAGVRSVIEAGPGW